MKLGCQRTLRDAARSVPRANGAHITIAQLGVGVSNAAWSIGAALHHHIFHVDGVGSGEQMVRSNAGWCVTRVQHVQPVRNWSEVKAPRKAVRPVDTKERRLDGAVTAPVRRSSPEPAAGRFANLAPKVSNRFVSTDEIMTSGTAVFAPSAFEACRFCWKSSPATEAGAFSFGRVRHHWKGRLLSV